MVNTIQYSCFESLPNSTIFLSENSTISVMTVFKESVMDEEIINLGGGIFDEGSFNDITGREYSVESPCISYTGAENLKVTSCCTSFTTALPDSSINAPTCKKYQSRSTVYDISDNYKIIATAKVYYTYSLSTLFANVTFSGQDDWIVELAGNLDDDCSALVFYYIR
uniref:Uncharacterized protein n=1 Tax=Panagrolaimus sp. PS1159 TaxID=55785 RepID=A0AC35FKR8_9BILA